jgi:hypothetical protein
MSSRQVIPALDTQQLMLLFRHYAIKNLFAAGRISQTAVDILDRFHHPGFPAYEGEGIPANDSAARERLASCPLIFVQQGENLGKPRLCFLLSLKYGAMNHIMYGLSDHIAEEKGST